MTLGARSKKAFALFVVLATSLVALGCGRDRPVVPIPLPSTLDEPRTPLEARLRERGPIDAPTLVPQSAPFEATFAEGERRSFSAVLRGAGLCYKVLGQAGDGVTDVDLLLFDPNNVLQQRDDDVGPEPVVGGRRPICPSEPGMWRIEVVAAAGTGTIAAQVWVAP